MAKNFDEKPFGDLCAPWQSQLAGEEDTCPESEEVLSLKDAQGYDGLILLGKAYDRQLKYRRSIEAYTKAVALEPSRPEALRLRAGKYLSTLQCEKALEDFERCLTLGADEAEIRYRMGICRYLLADYEDAMAQERLAFPLFDGEMGIAATFWHTLSALKTGRPTELLFRGYERDMDVGHHTAYQFAMGIAAGMIGRQEAEERLNGERDDLEFSIMAYGAAVIGRCRGLDTRQLSERILARDSFWISFGWLAAYAERNR